MRVTRESRPWLRRSSRTTGSRRHRGGASRAEDAGYLEESAAGGADEGDVTSRRSDDEAGPDTGEPDLVIRVADD